MFGGSEEGRENGLQEAWGKGGGESLKKNTKGCTFLHARGGCEATRIYGPIVLGVVVAAAATRSGIK